LLPPHTVFFVVGLEAVSARDRVLYAPAAVFRRFLAERAAEGVQAETAMRDSAGLSQYLRRNFEEFLKEHSFPAPRSTRIDVGPRFALGIVGTEHHQPWLTLITVSQNAKKTLAATSIIDHGMSGMFTRSDPMYVGQMDVILGLAKRDSGFVRFTNDPYIKQFLLTNFGIPLDSPDVALHAARRLISVTSEGLKLMPDTMPSVSSESVCAVLDYASETAEFR
jgi:hypothetical protein